MNQDLGSTESTIINDGHKPVSGQALEKLLLGNTILGEFAAIFRYIMRISPDGALEGLNNVGSHHVGQMTIDKQANTVSVVWPTGWENTTSRVYEVDGKLKFYNIENGQWSTTFYKLIDGIDHPLVSPE